MGLVITKVRAESASTEDPIEYAEKGVYCRPLLQRKTLAAGLESSYWGSISESLGMCRSPWGEKQPAECHLRRLARIAS